MTDNDLAYAAGFFDGEGTVGVNNASSNTGRGLPTLVAQVCNTDEAVVVWFRDSWGGSIFCKPTPDGKNFKPCYIWRASGNVARKFLEDIAPFARVKKDRVRWARAYQALQIDGAITAHWTQLPNRQWPAGLVQAKRAIAAKLKVMNLRGLPAVA